MQRSASQARPRILQLVTHDAPGGVSTLAGMVEAGLGERGYRVETRALRPAKGWLAAPGTVIGAAGAILIDRPDCIFGYHAAASIFGSLLGWLRGVPLRVAHQTAAPEAVRPFWRWLDRLFGTAGIHTHLVANSVATRSEFARWPERYRKRFVLIPHGVEPLPVAAGIDWRERLAIPPQCLLLVASGRLTDQKNHTIAVDALPLLGDVHLAIAGEGPNRAALESQASELGVADRLHLLGNLEPADLGALLAAGDIYLFPSVWETFGLAGVEAAIAGLPIVAADLPVLREVLGLEPPTNASPMVRFHAPASAADLAAAVRETVAAYPPAESRNAFAAVHRERHGCARMLDLYEGFLGGSIADRLADRALPPSAARSPRR